jgi:hypothetical protein
MRKLILAASLWALFLPAVAVASSLDGTWKVDLKSVQFSTKPDVFVLQHGMYDCKTCAPPISVKADGMDHAVTGYPTFDTVSIKIVDNNTIEETDKKAGRTVSVAKTVVSADGKVATIEFTDTSSPSSSPVTGKVILTRVAQGPTGSHAVSGSWRASKLGKFSDNALTITFKTEGNSLHMTNPTGESYTAKLDGTEAPVTGDPGVTSVSVKRIGANTFEETLKRDGKPTSVAHITVSADGKTLTVRSHNVLTDRTTKYTAVKL